MSTTDAAALQRSRTLCRRLAAEGATNFHFAFRVLPAAERRAMFALYAFCRVADDISDEPMPDGEREARFRRLEADLGLTCAGAPPRGGIFPALGEACARHRLPLEELREVIGGCRMDREVTRYGTFDELHAYCWKVACIIGALTMRIAGVDPAAHPTYVRDGGTAVQMTNILRDVGEDAARGRIYLPGEDLSRFGVPEQDILARRATPALRDLVQFEAERVRALYRSAEASVPRAVRDRLLPLEIIQRIYRRVLDRLEAQGYDPFAGRASLPRSAKIAIALGFMVRRSLGL